MPANQWQQQPAGAEPHIAFRARGDGRDSRNVRNTSRSNASFPCIGRCRRACVGGRAADGADKFIAQPHPEMVLRQMALSAIRRLAAAGS